MIMPHPLPLPPAARPDPTPAYDHGMLTCALLLPTPACLQRSGSSLAAIKKYIGDKYKGKLPAHWEKMCSVQCKRMADKGALVKVGSSVNCLACTTHGVCP